MATEPCGYNSGNSYLVTHWWKFDLETQNFQNGCVKVLSKLQSDKFVAKLSICENNVAFRIPQISIHAIQSQLKIQGNIWNFCGLQN